MDFNCNLIISFDSAHRYEKLALLTKSNYPKGICVIFDHAFDVATFTYVFLPYYFDFDFLFPASYSNHTCLSVILATLYLDSSNVSLFCQNNLKRSYKGKLFVFYCESGVFSVKIGRVFSLFPLEDGILSERDEKTLDVFGCRV